MSAVTLQEIADLVAAKLAVPLAHMRGIASNRQLSEAHKERARAARNVAIVLAWRHTATRLSAVGRFFDMAGGGNLMQQLNTIIETASLRIGGDAALASAVEEIEQAIDALHERRMAMRDRKAVRV